jgi:hypothetical protein
MRVWQAVPGIFKQAASKWVEDNYRTRTWHLHAALPIEKNVRKTRSFLQKAILGEVVRQGTSGTGNVLLIFTSTADSDKSHTDTLDATEEVKSVSSQASASVSDGAVSRVELSTTDVAQMREWLLNKGLSPKKVDHLESLITIRNQVPSSLPQPISYGVDELPVADRAETFDTNRQVPSATVRFAGDTAPYSTAGARVPNKLGSYDNDNALRVEPRSSLYAPRQVPSGSRNQYNYYPPPPPVTIYNKHYMDTSPSRHALHIRDETWRSRDREPRYGIERGRTITIDPERPYRRSSSDYYTDATASSRGSSPQRERSGNHRVDGRRHHSDSRPSRTRRSRAREYTTREREWEAELARERVVEEIMRDKADRQKLERQKERERDRKKEGSPQYGRERYEVIEVDQPSAQETDLRAEEVEVLRPPPRPVQTRTGFAATPKTTFDTSGDAIYGRPISLSMPRAERDITEIRRSSRRSRGAASENVLGWGEMDRWARQPKPGAPRHSYVYYGSSRRKGSGRSDFREHDASYVSDDDMEPFRQRQAKRIPTESKMETEVLTIRRDLSPEQIREIAEDAEDAMLDDEELKDKMLTRYTSVAAPPVASDTPVGNTLRIPIEQCD